jgi:hypothetical protein
MDLSGSLCRKTFVLIEEEFCLEQLRLIKKGNSHSGRIKAVKLLKTRRFVLNKFKLVCERIALMSRKFGGHFPMNSAGGRLRRKTIVWSLLFESEASGDHGMLFAFTLRCNSNESSTVTRVRSYEHGPYAL